MPEIDKQELSEYLKAIVSGIDKGLENSGFDVSSEHPIIVELAVINTKKAEGGLKIFVAEAGGKYKKEEISKIKIQIKRKIDISLAFV